MPGDLADGCRHRSEFPGAQPQPGVDEQAFAFQSFSGDH
jgi:hypothetical protein